MRIINQLFPLYLTLINNFTLFIGLVINPQLLSYRLLLINLFWQTFFVAIYQIAKSQIMYKILIIFFGIIAFIESFFWFFQKGPFSVSGLFIVSATNFQESTDFLSYSLDFSVLLILPLFILIYLGIKQKQSFQSFKYQKIILGVFIFSFLIFVADNALHDRMLRKGTPNFFKVAIGFQQEMKGFLKAKENNSWKEIDANPTETKQTVVLIIGESSNRNHWQLYGKKEKTTPKLASRNDLYVFKNVVSAYSSTIKSVLTSLTESNLENKIKLNDAIDIMDVFHAAGYTTYWISNQSPIGVWENPVTILGEKADHTIFTNIGSSSSMESTQTRSYDELLFTPTRKALEKDDSLRFIVIHTMGNHSSYDKRYPTEFAHFKGKDTKTKTIATYHNSILYHDYILDSLIHLIETNTKNSVVVYASDHGENVYDDDDKVGHGFAGKLSKSNVEIPFFIWTSKDYSHKNTLFKSRSESPYITDNLFHTIIDLAKIETSIFEPKSSIIHPEFDSSRKRILFTGEDYDE